MAARARGRSDVVRLLVRPSQYVSGPQVLDELRRVIASGQVPPGDPIPLDEVAAFFGVSVIPVREALKTLLGEGLLEHQPRLGYTVTALQPAELAEMYVVRGALEAAALTAAVQHASTVDDDRIRQVQQRLVECVRDGDLLGFQRSSREFHEAMLHCCRMPRLLHVLDLAWNLTEPIQTMRDISDAERALLLKDHQEMLTAFVDRDIDRLRTLAVVHHERVTSSISHLTRPS